MEEASEWAARCPAPCYAVDSDGTVVGWNDAATPRLGRDAGEDHGRSSEPTTAPESTGSLAAFHARIAAGDHGGTEVELEHRDGSTRLVHVEATVFDSDGAATVVIGVVSDLTSVATATDDARREAERLRALMHNVSDTIAVLDPGTKLVFLGGNPGGTLGYDDADLEGANALEHVHPDDVERIAGLWAELLATPGAEVRGEYRAATAAGGWVYAEANAINLLDDPLVGGIVLTSRNITDRKRGELLLAGQAATLARLIEGAPTAVALDEVLSVVNELVPGAISAVVGADAPELLTDPVPVVPDGYRAAVEAWARRAAGSAWGTEPVVVPAGTGEGAGADLAELDRVLRANGYSCSWTVPLTAAAGARPLGHLLVHLPEHRHPDDFDRRMLETLRGLASIAIEHGRTEWLAREALYDSLTGLPNRTLVLDRLERALSKRDRDGTVVGLVFFDLDNFKVVNDSFGHAAGDDLLRTVGQRLEGVVRPGDTVGRLGGDEFVVLCESVTEEDVVGVAARLADSFGRPFLVEQAERFVTASFGIAVARRPDDDAESLLRDADAAMYQAKERGRARYEVFDDSMRLRALERLSLETRLRAASTRGEFRIHYQPAIDLSSGAIVGAEALLRWQQGDDTVVAAKDFIGLAESTGVIAGLAPWVFRQACDQARRWSDERNGHHRLSVAVNLSARQLTDPELVTQLRTAIGDAGIDPSLICIELTEGTLMANEDRNTAVLAVLKEVGVRLAIEGFGTGYSSLSYLKHLPVDVVKVDRSFVDGLGRNVVDDRIVAAIVGLAHSLGLQVVAEGVETEQQRAALIELGCDVGQGFYWSTAVPASELDRMLAGNPDRRSARPDRRGRPG